MYGTYRFYAYVYPFISAQRYANGIYVDVVCLSLVFPSVRSSVRPFVTRRYCVKTAKHKIAEIAPHDSTGTLVF